MFISNFYFIALKPSLPEELETRAIQENLLAPNNLESIVKPVYLPLSFQFNTDEDGIFELGNALQKALNNIPSFKLVLKNMVFNSVFKQIAIQPEPSVQLEEIQNKIVEVLLEWNNLSIPISNRLCHYRNKVVGPTVLRDRQMNEHFTPAEASSNTHSSNTRGRQTAPRLRCAIYTRKSTDEGLDQDFNSLDAQREACAAYITSQASLGWKLSPKFYDDGGISGGTMERPALQQLLADIKQGLVDIIVVYKIDRLTRSLMDFAKMVDVFDEHKISFVSVTQQFNTTTSMGRLTLNVLLSFAQFEREVTAERIKDKIAGSKKKGMWMGGLVPLGYNAED